MSDKPNEKTNTEEPLPRQGEMGVFDGKLAICIKPTKEAWGWIIEDTTYRIKLFDVQRWYFGQCVKVDQFRQAVVLKLKNHDTDEGDFKDFVVLPITRITRFETEYLGWEGNRKIAQQAEDPSMIDSKKLFTLLNTVEDDSHSKTWKRLLGESAYSRLRHILKAGLQIAQIVETSNSDFIDILPTDMKQNIVDIQNNLKTDVAPIDSFEDLSRSEESAYGAVMGALVGDAAGGVLEFLGRIPTPLECEKALSMPGGGVFDLAPGQFTDDGEMTVSLLTTLARHDGVFNQLQVAKAYNAWAKSSPFDIGNATSNALRIDHRNESDVSIDQVILEQARRHNLESKANGSLMRATPLGIAACRLTIEDTVNMGIMDASLTHPNPTCQTSTAAYVLAIRHLILKPGDNKGAFLAALRHARGFDTEVKQWLQEAQEGELVPSHPMAGFVRHGFTLAFYFLYRGTPYKKAILETLARGGDTDTNACIVGGLIGALHGINLIPNESLSKVLKCNTREGQARPAWYTSRPTLRHLKQLCNTAIV